MFHTITKNSHNRYTLEWAAPGVDAKVYKGLSRQRAEDMATQITLIYHLTQAASLLEKDLSLTTLEECGTLLEAARERFAHAIKTSPEFKALAKT